MTLAELRDEHPIVHVKIGKRFVAQGYAVTRRGRQITIRRHEHACPRLSNRDGSTGREGPEIFTPKTVKAALAYMREIETRAWIIGGGA